MAALATVTSACKPDPAKAVKIVDAPTAAPAVQSGLPPWDNANCTLQPEHESGTSTFVAEGPCPVRQNGNAICRSADDDMHIMFMRKARGDATVAAYINVETYHGQDSYKNAQMLLTYYDGKVYYYWSSDSVHITVAAGEKSVTLPTNLLQAEPPNQGVETVSGELVCGGTMDPSLDPTTKNHG